MKKKLAIWLGVVAAAMLLPQAAWATKCFIFVHGHYGTKTTVSYSEARAYWYNDDSWPMDDTDFADIVTSGGSGSNGWDACGNADNKCFFVGYNSQLYYWDAAKEAAAQINTALAGGADKGGNTCPAWTSGTAHRYYVVSHSMGGQVMDFILGNANTTDPYYNYGSAPFSTIKQKLNGGNMSFQGAHRGTTGADGVCGHASWALNLIGGLMGDCDLGTQSLQTADAWRNAHYSSPSVTSYLVGGWEMIWGNGGFLYGEDDGLIEYASSFACNAAYGSAWGNFSQSNICLNTAKWKSAGFKNGDQSAEDHDEGRNGDDPDVRKAATGGLWGTSTTGTQVRSSMSNAEMVRCVWATNPGSACN